MPDFASDFDRAFDELDPLDPRGQRTNYVTLLAMRQALPQYDRKTFDEELNKLRRAQRYSLDASDGRHKRMTKAEAGAGIQDWANGPVLVYVARRYPPTENPASDPLDLATFYVDGVSDSSSIDLDYFDLPDMARQVAGGADRIAVVRAAVDVYFREAEGAGSREEWYAQNEEVVAEAQEDGLEAEAVYEAWKRGWRDGATQYLAGQPLQDEIVALVADD